MTRIGQPFRLTSDSNQAGLEWNAAGPALAGIQLLAKDAGLFAPRPAHEIGRLVGAAYGATVDCNSVSAGLAVVARALNEDQIGRAMVAALQLRLPELDWDAAVRLASANDSLAKFDPDQPRDSHGRWTDEGQAESSVAGRGNWRDPQPSARRTPPQTPQPSLQGDTESSAEAADPTDHPLVDGRVTPFEQQVSPETLTPAAYNGVYHDMVVAAYADELRSRGELVETSVRLRLGDEGPSAIIDILSFDPKEGIFYGVEVKTGEDPKFTDFQLLIYTHAILGGSVEAADIKVMRLGLIPNSPLLPIPIWLMYNRGFLSERQFGELDANKMSRRYRGEINPNRKVSTAFDLLTD